MMANLPVILSSVRITVLYFGVLKDSFGCAQERLELEDGSQVEHALRLLQGRASNLQAAVWASFAVAVNREYSNTSTVLHDGDEVALLPPVSGGIDLARSRVSK